MKIRLQDILFIDFEASSLSEASWPIEVGGATLDGNRITTWSSIIKPAPEWPLQDWSNQSEAVHGISQAELWNAPDAWRVADEFADFAGARQLVSDAPNYDQVWLDRLIEQSSREFHSSILSFNTVADSLFSETSLALDLVYEELERTKAPHRAGADASRLAYAIMKAQAVERGETPSPFG